MEVSGQVNGSDSATGTIGSWVGPTANLGSWRTESKMVSRSASTHSVQNINCTLAAKKLVINLLRDIFKIKAIPNSGLD
jgi:hypothetical protein